MPHAPTPWVGLAALVAMFVLPRLPAWLFEGPPTIRHRPRRHVCGDCDAPWTTDHTCPAVAGETDPPLQAELRRLAASTDLQRRHTAPISRTHLAAHAARVHEAGVADETARPRHKPARALTGRSQPQPTATAGDKTSLLHAD